VNIKKKGNHFLFTPLLASASTGTLEFRDISEPLQQARRHDSYNFVSASVKKINKDEKTIECYTEHREDPNFKLSYDKLVVAVGCDVNTMNIPGVTEHACFMKELRHARWIRHKIIDCFEHASIPNISMQKREKLLRFVIVGAGPTGVEAAGNSKKLFTIFKAEIHDFIKQDLKKIYPSLYLDAKITVVEGSPQVLGAFDDQLQEYAQQRFRRQYIKIKTGTRVKEVSEEGVLLDDGSKIECSFVLWSAGIQPRKLIALDERSPGLPKDSRKKLIVDDNLKVKGENDIYSMGDCSVVEGKQYAATAQVAQQQGKYLADKLNYEAKHGKEYEKPFTYRHFGSMVFIFDF
jgi:NADH:ubiquinone reductase (non-electrogenic)